jgi:hypothetical protein
MQGFISSWNRGSGRITRCPQGDVFLFALNGVIDNELFIALQKSAAFRDSGQCPGNVPVQFASQEGVAVSVRRVTPQVTWQEF